MRMIARWEPNPATFIGRTIETTDGRTGVVEAAHLAGTLVRLSVRGEFGDFFNTDNEHATIKREG